MLFFWLNTYIPSFEICGGYRQVQTMFLDSSQVNLSQNLNLSKSRKINNKPAKKCDLIFEFLHVNRTVVIRIKKKYMIRIILMSKRVKLDLWRNFFFFRVVLCIWIFFA